MGPRSAGPPRQGVACPNGQGRSRAVCDNDLVSDTTTNGIRIQVRSEYLPDRSSPPDDQYVFAYHITISNIGTDVALVCFDSIAAQGDQRRVRALLEESGRTVVPIDAAQMGEFAGNALELTGRDGGVFVMSARGWESLHASQRAVIEARLDVLPVRIPAVEHSGGSARCTLAGIHLPPR